jgi:hypothetical protein
MLIPFTFLLQYVLLLKILEKEKDLQMNMLVASEGLCKMVVYPSWHNYLKGL